MRAISGRALQAGDPLAFAQAELKARYDAAIRQVSKSNKGSEELTIAKSKLKNNYDKLLESLPAEIALQKQLDMLNDATALQQETGGLRSTAATSMLARITEVSQSFRALRQNSEELLRQKGVEAQVEARRIDYIAQHGELSNELIQSLEHYREALHSTTKAQLALEQKLKPLLERVQLATELTNLVADAQKNLAASLITGGDLQAALDQYLTSIAGTIFDALLDAAFKPIEKVLQDTFLKAFGVENWEDQLLKIQQDTKDEIKTQGNKVAEAINSLPQKLSVAQPNGGTATGNPSQSVTEDAGDAVDNLNSSLTTTAKNADNAAANSAKFGEKLTEFVGSLGMMASGIAMGFAGVERMKEGGTYNTLMGLAGIFGGIGSVAMGGNNLINMFRANGGPVNANHPYIIGERGPELFVPFQSGQVLSNNETEAMMSSAFSRNGSVSLPFTRSSERITSERHERETLAAIRDPGPIDVRYESSVINGVEYVTAEQHRKGMAQAAERGRALTLQALQNSPRTRAKVGI